MIPADQEKILKEIYDNWLEKYGECSISDFKPYTTTADRGLFVMVALKDYFESR